MLYILLLRNFICGRQSFSLFIIIFIMIGTNWKLFYRNDKLLPSRPSLKKVWSKHSLWDKENESLFGTKTVTNSGINIHVYFLVTFFKTGRSSTSYSWHLFPFSPAELPLHYSIPLNSSPPQDHRPVDPMSMNCLQCRIHNCFHPMLLHSK